MASNYSAQIQQMMAQQRRPVWSYTDVRRAPANGPQPRLAQGSGRTAADPGLPGNAPGLPGYLTDNHYTPNLFAYDPSRRDDFLNRIPRTINVGTDGLAALNPTYRAHDVVNADRFNHQMRRAPAWQNMAYPPDSRNLLAYKQVEKYQVFSNTLSARPLSRNNYFVGYQIDQDVAGQIGGQGLGSMGSM